MSSIGIDGLTGDLRADLALLGHAFRAAVVRTHPQAAVLLLTRPFERLASQAPLETALQVFASAGADPETAVHVLRTVLAVMTGTLLREADAAVTLAQADSTSAADRRRAFEGTGLPAVAAAAP